MLLLKLHGSVNWRVQFGEHKPYGHDALLHHEEWSGLTHDSYYAEAERLLDHDAFIVPPVLTKSALAVHPILSLVWFRAYEVMSRAEHVVFIGYSMPLTDVGGGFLFRESLGHLLPRDNITIVGYAHSEEERRTPPAALVDAYGSVFGDVLPLHRFNLSGAKAWIQQALSQVAV